MVIATNQHGLPRLGGVVGWGEVELFFGIVMILCNREMLYFYIGPITTKCWEVELLVIK